MKKTATLAALLLAAAVGCGKKDEQAPAPQADPAAQEPTEQAAKQPPPSAGPKVAVAELQAAPDSKVAGRVTFTKVEGGVQIDAQITGLTPGSKHGFHVHETGECAPPDFKSAGGHFDPTGHPHAGPEQEQRHVGDMGNLEADSEGRANKQMTSELMTLTEGQQAIVGKAVIVHAGEDDLKTQPTGDAGGRLACGIIEVQGAEGGAGSGAQAGDEAAAGDEAGGGDEAAGQQ